MASAQADVVAALAANGTCSRHLGWLGAAVGHVIRTEISRRSLLPGRVDVRFVAVDAEPFEGISSSEARSHGTPVVERVRAFVAQSSLSAIVEIDCAARRARVSLQLSGDDPATMVLESTRLVHTSAQEISDALRQQRARG